MMDPEDSRHNRPRVHVFLGAPPPCSDPDLLPESGSQDKPRPPWTHLELTWQEGGLRPAADFMDPDSLPQGSKDKTNPDQDGDRTADESQGREERVGRGDQCWAVVRKYLDDCFPADPLGPEPLRHPEHHALSVQNQALATWTLSQALMLKGGRDVQSASGRGTAPPPGSPPSSVSSSTPELFSPEIPSPGPPAELRGQSPRVENGGVVLQVTADGVLCSQEAERHSSPSELPDPKKPRLSEEFSTEVSTSAAARRGAPTLLGNCDKVRGRCSVLVAVLHPCHLKEVKVKSGPSAGTFVPLASIVVTDQSAIEMKVLLWRRAAFWVLTVSPGDVLLITELQVSEDRWRAETLLQSTFSSKLLNLGQAGDVGSAPSAGPQLITPSSLSSLLSFLRERRPLLVSLPHRRPQDLKLLPYAALRSLQVNTLVHVLLRVTHTYTAWRGEAESHCRSAQLQAVVTVEQPDGHKGELVLWGGAVDWLRQFRRNRAAVWDVRFLLVREGLTFDLPELHSTPWSSAHRLHAADRRVHHFLFPPKMTSSSLELDLHTLLSQKYCGDVDLRVQVVSFQFQNSPPSQNAPQQVLDSCTPLAGIVAALSDDITYTGCGRCSVELDADANGVYATCYPCLPLTAVRRYYRPAVLTVSGRGSSPVQVQVQVPPVPLQKILQVLPDKLQRSSGPGSEVKLVQVAAERIWTLLHPPGKTFILTARSHFLSDENSVTIAQDVTLLDLQVPADPP